MQAKLVHFGIWKKRSTWWVFQFASLKIILGDFICKASHLFNGGLFSKEFKSLMFAAEQKI